MKSFDITGPLPGVTHGGLLPTTTLLEASAGTGKTWAIAGLIARYLAEGHVTIDQILAVTFTNAATGELKDRVRGRLVEVAEALEQAVAGTAPAEADPVITSVLEAPEDEIATRLRRVRAALADYDSATIVTIHQFCHLVLRGLGVAGDTDPRATLVEDLDLLRQEVVDDIYLRDFADTDLSHEVAGQIARHVAGAVGVRLAPAEPDPNSPDARRLAFAEQFLAEFDFRKRKLAVLSYDDLLSQLASALRQDDAVAKPRMRDRWRVVLVDEFQDTDPVQWEVFERAFRGHAVLTLVGDPKQAIYQFRGGDVHTYLRAAADADFQQTLDRNFRSDPGLVDSLHQVLAGATLGHPDIQVHPIEAARQTVTITGDDQPAFQVRTLTRADLDAREDKLASVGSARPRIAADLGAEVQRLLTSGVSISDGQTSRAIQPHDIAVLAHSWKQLAQIQRELLRLGIPAVMSGGASVFHTQAATEWRALLEAMLQPNRANLVRHAAVTSFFGRTVDDLIEEGEAATEELSEAVRTLSLAFQDGGIAAVYSRLVSDGMHARVLGRVGGERHLTDLRQISELLHDVVQRERISLAALLAWFTEQQEEKAEGTTERTRRIDSDAAAVQLVSIHGSKGLEFPVVLAPALWDRYLPGNDRDEVRFLTYHDDDGNRVLDLSERPADHLKARERAEDLGESLRLMYVAMTRARSRLIVWWAAANNAPAGPLTRVMLGRGPGVAELPERVDIPSDVGLVKWFSRWAELGGPAWRTADGTADPKPISHDVDAALEVRHFDRTVDELWRRTSYSALTAADQPTAAVVSEPEVVPKDDEPEVEELPETALEIPEVPSPMADFPVGARFGSLVHGVLEHADPGAEDWIAELTRRTVEQLVDWPVDVEPADLADAIAQVCATPMGPLADGLTLREVGQADRLCELDFELPMGGGDRPGQSRLLGEVAELLRRHLPDGDPVRAWADVLDGPGIGEQVLRGYLTGSVDLVFRTPAGRYLICDYKTNWLGPRDEPLTAASYAPPLLDAAMGHSSYPLQALLYAVVLHRYLRWRLSGYDPQQHLGGVLYLYVRGMCGPETPVVDGNPCGVFSWQPPAELVLELSDLLDGAA